LTNCSEAGSALQVSIVAAEPAARQKGQKSGCAWPVIVNARWLDHDTTEEVNADLNNLGVEV